MFRLLLAIRIEVLFLFKREQSWLTLLISVLIYLYLNGMTFRKVFVHSTSETKIYVLFFKQLIIGLNNYIGIFLKFLFVRRQTATATPHAKISRWVSIKVKALTIHRLAKPITHWRSKTETEILGEDPKPSTKSKTCFFHLGVSPTWNLGVSYWVT